MPPKRRRKRSTLSHIKTQHTADSIPEAPHFAPNGSHSAPEASHLAPANDVPCPQIQTEAQLSDESVDVAPTLVASKRRRQFWTVQVRKSDEEFKESNLRVNDVWLLPVGEKVFVPFDGAQPSGTNAFGILGGFLGQLGSNHSIFPIGFKSWHKVPTSYKNGAWNNHIKAKFWWDPIHESAARAYIMKDIGKKWRESRIRLFGRYYDSTKSREEIISNPPLSITETEWASFIDYRLKPKTQEICDKNARNRRKLTINHTGGSKKIKRRAAEIMSETGQPVSRGLVYVETRKRHDGSFVNDEARAICEKIIEIESLGIAPISPSPNDSLGQVFGKEHPGRVRGVGSGVCPSQLFGSYQRYSGAGSSSVVASDPQVQKVLDDLKQKLESETQRRMALEERFNKLCKILNLRESPEPVVNSNNSPTEPDPVQSSSSQSSTHFS